MVVSNGCNPDPRVEKEAAALAGAGYRVRVLAWDRSAELPPEREHEGFTIESYARPSRVGTGLRQLSSG